MLLKDRADCRLLHEGSKLKGAKDYQTVKAQTLFPNCRVCLVAGVLANTPLVHTSMFPGDAEASSRDSRDMLFALSPVQPSCSWPQ